LAPVPNHQSPIPNPQSPTEFNNFKYMEVFQNKLIINIYYKIE